MRGIVVGLIGFGTMGKVHRKTLERLKRIGAIRDVFVYDSAYEGLNSLDEIDDFCTHVIVATPTETHLEYINEYSDRPVLVEKPCVPFEDFGSIEMRTTLQVGYAERYNPILDLFWKFKPSELPQYVKFERTAQLLPAQYKKEGVVRDIGIHDYDLTRYLFGGRAEIVVGRTIMRDRIGLDIAVRALLVFDNGLHVETLHSWVDGSKTRMITVYYSDMTYVIDLVRMSLTRSTHETGQQDVYYAYGESVRNEVEDFLFRLDRNRHTHDLWGKRAQQVAESILTSTEEV